MEAPAGGCGSKEEDTPKEWLDDLQALLWDDTWSLCLLIRLV